MTLSKDYSTGLLEDWARTNHLNNSIDEEFGHLAPDEVAILAASYDEAFAEIFKLVRVGKKKSTFKILYALDGQYNVTLPASIMADLKEQDVFWAVIGLREKEWHLVYLSHHYSF